jgi:hypothetical protein
MPRANVIVRKPGFSGFIPGSRRPVGRPAGAEA